MKRLAAGMILIAVNCVLAQEPDRLALKPTITLPAPDSAAKKPLDISSLLLSPSLSNLAENRADDPVRLSSQEAKQLNSFVIVNGALFMRLPIDQSLVPVAGGGASGCFSLDLPRRISNLKEFIPRLEGLTRPEPQRQ